MDTNQAIVTIAMILLFLFGFAALSWANGTPESKNNNNSEPQHELHVKDKSKK